MKNSINKIIKINKNNFVFTDDEKTIANKYTEFYNDKIKEKETNPNYLDPQLLIFMNDGYTEIDNDGYPFDSIETKKIILNKKYKNFKYQANLYKRLLDFAEIKNNKNIEVLIDIGCGKGGGVSFYKDFYNFKHCIGIDITKINIDIAKKHAKNINFYIASATNLPIKDSVVDVITCVESLNYYVPILNFIKETYRILKNNGKILISMQLNEEEENNLENIFLKNGFTLDKKEDITKNVRIACAISKFRFMDISFQEALMMHSDEQRYYGPSIKYKNFIFVKKEGHYA
jgi:ubiquinone/menaquinone biosynthesis C-methylase UbiE